MDVEKNSLKNKNKPFKIIALKVLEFRLRCTKKKEVYKMESNFYVSVYSLALFFLNKIDTQAH